MKLDTALEEYGLLLRRRHRGEGGLQAAAALSALREYLMDYSGYEETAEVSPRDLFTFLLEYYPSQETPLPSVALTLLEAAAGLSLWMAERGDRSLAEFAAAEDRLKEDLPRVLEALASMQAHARRDDLGGPVLVSGSNGTGEEGAEEEAEEEEAQSPLGTLGSGVNRVARLDQIDYPAAEEDYYRVVRVTPDAVTLQSAGREALGEGLAEPVRVPARAAELLRAGDTIHAEIAPGPAGWELLEVYGVRPGGYE